MDNSGITIHDGSRIEAVAENVWTRITARYSVIFVSCIGLPLMGVALTESYSVIKEMGREQVTLSGKVDLLAQKVELTAENQRSIMLQSDLKIEGVRAEIRDRTMGRYTVDDANRDLKLRDQELIQHERRLNELEHEKNVRP
jgi:hypothetical protein